MKEVFRNRNFRNLFWGNLFSNFASGITFIGLSWYMVNETGSVKVLGSAMMLTSVLVFLVSPYVGVLIDRFSRKMILARVTVIGALIPGIFSVWGFWHSYQPWMLVLIGLAGTLVFQVHGPAEAALVQEMFTENEYKEVNSLLEIQVQTAGVLAGGLSGIALGVYGLPIVLVFDALTYVLAYWFFSRLDYTFTLHEDGKVNAGNSWLSQLGESWTFAKQTKGFILFSISALVPIVGAMTLNMLIPSYVSQALKADVYIYSLSEFLMGVGALAAGILLGSATDKLGDVKLMIGNKVLFGVLLVIICLFQTTWLFLVISLFLGWCYAITRVIRQSLYMSIVPKQMMGRVMSFLNSLSVIMRLALVMTFTLIIDQTGVEVGFYIVAGLQQLAAVGIYYSLQVLVDSVRNNNNLAETVAFSE